jgi:hypothetical protein
MPGACRIPSALATAACSSAGFGTPLHVEQTRQAAGADPPGGFTAALGVTRENCRSQLSRRMRWYCSGCCTT